MGETVVECCHIDPRPALNFLFSYVFYVQLLHKEIEEVIYQ